MNPSDLLFHIPHASTTFPWLDGYFRTDLLGGEVEKLTDWCTDEIFSVSGIDTLKAEFSRVFCDVERFVSDDREPMAAQGMGFYYTRTDDGQEFRREGNEKERVLRDYYLPHHSRLTALVRQKLDSAGRCCLIDGHSFSAVPFLREFDQNPARPDICLGTQGVHTPEWLVDGVRDVYLAVGLTVSINRPYSGSMVPLEFLDRDPRVLSLMIEVNRRLYRDGNRNIPGAVERLRHLTEDVIGAITDSEPQQYR